MNRKISFRLPTPLFQEIEQEASKQMISMADVVRDKILRMRTTQSEQEIFSIKIISLLEELDQKIRNLGSTLLQTSNTLTPENPLQLEILYLLRELLFERNSQLLRKVDEKLDRVIGKDRKKIL